MWRETIKPCSWCLVIGTVGGWYVGSHWMCEQHPDPEPYPAVRKVRHMGHYYEVKQSDLHRDSQAVIDACWYLLHRYDGSTFGFFLETDGERERTKACWKELMSWELGSSEVSRALQSHRNAIASFVFTWFLMETDSLAMTLSEVDPNLRTMLEERHARLLDDPEIRHLWTVLRAKTGEDALRTEDASSEE